MNAENERALAYLTLCARRYAREGTTTCGTCGKTPEYQPAFSLTMSCGHEWSTLVWTPHPRPSEKEGT